MQETKLDTTEISLIEVRLMAVRLMAARLEIMRLGRKFKNFSKSKKMVGSLDFFIPGAKLAFTKWRQAFFKALILHHFNPECHIWIETDV